jgi:hypothetical protein
VGVGGLIEVVESSTEAMVRGLMALNRGLDEHREKVRNLICLLCQQVMSKEQITQVIGRIRMVLENKKWSTYGLKSFLHFEEFLRIIEIRKIIEKEKRRIVKKLNYIQWLDYLKVQISYL